jgi:hypothetical protein
VNTATILDLITTREATATAAREELREQMTKLAGELAVVEGELSDLAITRQMLIKLTRDEVAAPEPAISSEPYQQILAVFTFEGPGLRAKTSASPSASAPRPKTPKVSEPSGNAWSTGAS